MVTGAHDLKTLGVWSAGVAFMSLITLTDCGLTDLVVRASSEAFATGSWGRLKGLYRRVMTLVAVTVAIVGAIAIPLIAGVLQALMQPLDTYTATVLAAGAAGVVWLNLLAVAAGGVLEGSGRYDFKALAALLASVTSIAVTWWALRHHLGGAIALGLLSYSATNFLALFA